MYLTLDIGTPVRSAYLTNLRVKNLWLKYWPTKWVGGVEVFDELTIYDGHVYTAEANLEIYKILGLSITDLQAGEYDGVDRLWMFFKPYHLSPDPITSNEVSVYLNSHSTIDEEITVKFVYTQTVADVSLTKLPTITNDQIVTMVLGGIDEYYPVPYVKNPATDKLEPAKVYDSQLVNYEPNISDVTFAAVMDTGNVLFDTSAVVLSRSINKVQKSGGTWFNRVVRINSYTINAVLDFKFTRTISAADGSVNSFITEIVDETNSADLLIPTTFYKQLRSLYDVANPVIDSELVYNHTVAGVDEEPDVTTPYIRKDGAEQLTGVEFSAMIEKSIDTDYSEEKGDWWVTILAIIIIIVVTYLTWGTGTAAAGAATAAGASAGTAAAVGFLVSLSFSMGISMLALSLVSMAFQKSGDYGNAIAMRGSITMLGVLSKLTTAVLAVVGIGLIIAAIKQAATEAAKQAALEASKEAGKDVIITETAVTVGTQVVKPTLTNWVQATVDYAMESVTGMFTQSSTTATLTKGMQALNK